MNIQVQTDGKCFWIRKEDGAFWLGPRFPISKQWEKPKEPGADVPCWITDLKESAEAQLLLLQSYTCAICKGRFEKDWDDQEAIAEFKRDFGRDPNDFELSNMVCHDCYEAKKEEINAHKI